VPYETQLLSGVYRCTCSLASISEAYSISRRVKGNQVIWNSRMTHGTNSSTSQILKSRNYGYFSKRSCLSGLTVIDTLASTLWSSRGWSLVVTQKNLKRRSHIQSHAHTRANTWHTRTHIPTYIIIDIHILLFCKFLAGNEFCVWLYSVDLNCIGVPILAQYHAGATLCSLNQVARSGIVTFNFSPRNLT